MARSIAAAAQKTRSVIEDLQTKLTEVSGPDARVIARGRSTPETEDELERQLQAHFAKASPTDSSGRAPTLKELRQRVIEGVVDRILSDWSSSQGGRLREDVMERLIERVLQQVQAKNS